MFRFLVTGSGRYMLLRSGRVRRWVEIELVLAPALHSFLVVVVVLSCSWGVLLFLRLWAGEC